MMLCIATTLLHCHLLSLHITYVSMPFLSIFSTHSICHHTIFLHSNVVLVYQTFKRKRAVSPEPENIAPTPLAIADAPTQQTLTAAKTMTMSVDRAPALQRKT